MKKIIFDLKMIMKRAWTCVKKHGMTLSAAMKWSWKKAKEEASSFVVAVIEITNPKGAKQEATVYGDNTVSSKGIPSNTIFADLKAKIESSNGFSMKVVA